MNIRKLQSIKDPGYAALAEAAKAPVTGGSCILVDGVPLLEAALSVDLPVKYVLWDETEVGSDYAAALNALLADRGTDIMAASFHLLKRLEISSGTPKCIFLAEKGEEMITSGAQIAALGSVLAIADVMDPMNVGVLLRHAEAFGYAVLACGATVALNSRQVIRSSTGSGLRKPFYRARPDAADLVAMMSAEGIQTIATSAHATKPVWELEWRRPHAILVGNESRGLDPEVRRAAEEDVAIPMVPGGAHSINVSVASSIMMFEGMKSR